VIVLFTDGISEAMNAQDEEWGEENLIRTVRGAGATAPMTVVEEVFRAADAFAAGTPQHDDMTLVVLGIR
jgi:phosphoserine phosphatase RsbU/P